MSNQIFKRLFQFLSGFLFSFSVVRAQLSATPLLKAPSAYGLQEECPKNLQITAKFWNESKIDEWIASYEKIDKLSVAICAPVRGTAWVVLFAIQEWNNQIQTYYSDVQNSAQMIRDISAKMVLDFFPGIKSKYDELYSWNIGTCVVAALAIGATVAVPILLPASMAANTIRSAAAAAKTGKNLLWDARAAVDAGQLGKVEQLRAEQDMSNTLKVFREFVRNEPHPFPKTNPNLPALKGLKAALTNTRPQFQPINEKRGLRILEKRELNIYAKRGLEFIQNRDLKKRDRVPSTYMYGRKTLIDNHATLVQSRLESILANVSETALTAPIYSDHGMAGILFGGNFLAPIMSHTVRTDIMTRLMTASVLSELFISLSMFITIGCDPCNDVGVDGAWDPVNHLSWCDKRGGTMYNIIRAQGDKSENEFPNAEAISKTYGFTVEILIKKAIDCQKRYGFFTKADPPPAVSFDDDCTFQLASCDCNAPDVRHKRHHHKTVVRACRDGAGLPI
ncbi:hypothetical protein O181_027173 [Austropuccinia psidii MF-1]|uniref:DUF7872 domain-containing protein n=1 Tax=Austropuccinia psidii MF-1 TaxID=1389203 RepID=A0A9Q3CP11_9BASI|nr:hypothetical protein [Austropuccinia psidii MF-1]